MQLKELGVIIPTEPHTNISAAISAAQQAPGAAVWIPAWYTGGDSVPTTPGVPVLDMRGTQGTFTGASSSTSVVDATAPKYGLKADVKRCNGWGSQATLTITNGSTTVSCSTANFTQADVGKIIFATNWNGVDSGYGSSQLILPQTTIQSVTNSTTVVVASAAVGSSSGTNGSLFWGTDDTTALATAWTDASTGSVCSTLLLPAKMMFVSNGLFNTASCPFSGTGNSAYASVSGWAVGSAVLVPVPNFNFAVGIPGSSVFFGFRAAGVYNITIDGGGNPVGGVHGFSIIASQIDGTISNVMVNGWGFTSTGFVGLTLSDGAHLFSAITIDGAGFNACSITGTVKAYQLFCGNSGNTPLVVNNSGSLTPFECNGCAYQNSSTSTSIVNIQAGEMIDDGGGVIVPGGSTVVGYLVSGANAILRLQNARVGSTANSFVGVVQLTGTNSKAYIENSEITASGTSSVALATAVGTGQQIFSRNNTIVANGTSGNCFNTIAGAQIIDQGGNTFTCTAFNSGAGNFVGIANSTNSVGVTAAKLVLSAGWGSTAAVTALAGGNAPIQFTITNSGTGQAASPTITYTFPTAYPVAPFSCTATQTGGTNAIGTFTSSVPTTTGVTFTYSLTPTAASTEIVNVTCVTP